MTKKAIEEEKEKIHGMLQKLETAKKGDGNKVYKRVMDNQRSKSNSIFNSFIADP